MNKFEAVKELLDKRTRGNVAQTYVIARLNGTFELILDPKLIVTENQIRNVEDAINKDPQIDKFDLAMYLVRCMAIEEE